MDRIGPSTYRATRGSAPRIAFFTDSFHEANGVALTSRQFAAFARSHFYPFFSVHTGPRTAYWKRGPFETYELAPTSAVLRLEHDLAFDLLFFRHRRKLRDAVAAFEPDLVHITGPGHSGMLGAMIAYDLGVPLVASWHTNVHEFGARRLRKVLGWAPGWAPGSLASAAERKALDLTVRFYRLAKLIFAPNPELVAMLGARTGRRVHLMQRGIDTDFFTPERRRAGERPFTIGYAGRLSAEKNVRLLAALHAELQRVGVRDHRFLVVGEGSERAWLREHLPQADLPGLLRGDDLANAYANMDVFVFPSETDTFGNVILEAMASGLPVVVSAQGGPKFLVEEGASGFVAQDARQFAGAVAGLYRDRQRQVRMRDAARQNALGRSWGAVFEGVYRSYAAAFGEGVLARRERPESPVVMRPRAAS